MKKAVIWCLLTIVCVPCSAAPLGVGPFEMISISADEAREDEQPGILHFTGQFRMQSKDWQLASSEATVYGRPDRPDRVYLEGSPARFLVYRTDQAEPDQIEATAMVVEYLREANLLTLSGSATLILGNEIIRSTNIEYDISANRYRAGGADGVLIEVPPVD